jgi:hypothetical protein
MRHRWLGEPGGVSSGRRSGCAAGQVSRSLGQTTNGALLGLSLASRSQPMEQARFAQTAVELLPHALAYRVPT